VQGAIASWQTALTAYQSTNDRANEAIVREKLAIAYQQIGQFEQAIDHWKEALANLSKLGDFGRLPEGATLAHRTCSNLQPIRAK
jgi:tetratricopeptide (TPR) repeat protein